MGSWTIFLPREPAAGLSANVHTNCCPRSRLSRALERRAASVCLRGTTGLGSSGQSKSESCSSSLKRAASTDLPKTSESLCLTICSSGSLREVCLLHLQFVRIYTIATAAFAMLATSTILDPLHLGAIFAPRFFPTSTLFYRASSWLVASVLTQLVVGIWSSFAVQILRYSGSAQWHLLSLLRLEAQIGTSDCRQEGKRQGG
jgi:hypothetical protein